MIFRAGEPTAKLRDEGILGVLFLVALIFGAGCAAPQLANIYTARSTGKGGVALDLATNRETLQSRLNLTYGLLQNMDLGGEISPAHLAVFGRYSIARPFGRDGLAFAVVSSLGTSVFLANPMTLAYTYFGPVISYRWGFFEGFAVVRFNHDIHKGTNADIPELGSIAPGVYNYLYSSLGVTLWPIQDFGVGLEMGFFGPGGGTPGVQRGPFFSVHLVLENAQNKRRSSSVEYEEE